jgi:hypothetical protein
MWQGMGEVLDDTLIYFIIGDNGASAYATALGAHGMVAGHQHSPNPAWDVYDNGHYVGSDPDPNVRMQLQFDHGSSE